MLYIVATPIGNRGDFSPRALEVLNQSQAIFCEDTRHSGTFLRDLGVSAPLISLHEHNESQRIDRIIERLEAGEHLSLISDAGLPGVCDPGQRLIRAVRQRGLPLSVIPGPCAFVTAWAHLGWELPLQFLGFLPQKGPEHLEFMTLIVIYPGATLFYEAPHRLKETLAELARIVPNRRVAIARELTKKFEEVVEDDILTLVDRVNSQEPRGEYVIAVAPPTKSEDKFLSLRFKEQVEFIEKTFLIEKMSAIKIVARISNVSKSTVYKETSLDLDN